MACRRSCRIGRNAVFSHFWVKNRDNINFYYWNHIMNVNATRTRDLRCQMPWSVQRAMRMRLKMNGDNFTHAQMCPKPFCTDWPQHVSGGVADVVNRAKLCENLLKNIVVLADSEKCLCRWLCSSPLQYHANCEGSCYFYDERRLKNKEYANITHARMIGNISSYSAFVRLLSSMFCGRSESNQME